MTLLLCFFCFTMGTVLGKRCMRHRACELRAAAFHQGVAWADGEDGEAARYRIEADHHASVL